MFTGNSEPPKYVKRTRQKPMIYDIQLPNPLLPGRYGHRGRQPNTDYHVRLFDYKQKQLCDESRFLAAEAKRLRQEKISARYDHHSEVQLFNRHIDDRFKEKVRAFEESVERRREKLRELLCREEQEEISDTIEKAQKGVEAKMQEMKIRAQVLKSQREAARMEIVNKKRYQQHTNDCIDLRPVLIKTNLMESKMAQLKQIQAKENRKEAERELENMWHEMLMKEIAAKEEREIQDMLKKNKIKNQMLETWDKQIRGKELLREEEEKVAAEDRMEMIKLQEQIRREEIEALDAKRRKRDQRAVELREQIAIQERFLEQRKKEEKALEQMFTKLAEIEIEKERQKIKDTTSDARREVAIYRNYLKELEFERKKEEEELNKLLKEHRIAIEKKQDEARCKLQRAREALQKSVLEGRAQQLEHKKQEAESQLKLKEAENELLRMICETNERLQAEADRLQTEKARQYGDDLKKQIEFNNEKRRLEKEQLERDLIEGLAEEERQRKFVAELIAKRLELGTHKHPFRQMYERGECVCPPEQ